MGNRYVTVSHDSFKNKTTAESYQLEYKLNARRFKLTEIVKFNFRHVSCEPDLDALVIDVHFRSTEANTNGYSSEGTLDTLKRLAQTYPGEWAFLRDGQLIIQINGVENITLEPHDSGSDVTTQNITNASACEELVFYEINKDILEKICKASIVRMQLSGGAATWTLDGTDMVFMAKAFWNGFYDENMYADELEHAANVADQQAQIKKKGCLIEIISAVIGLILAGSLSDVNDDLAGGLGALFLFGIPILVGVIRRRKSNKIK